MKNTITKRITAKAATFCFALLLLLTGSSALAQSLLIGWDANSNGGGFGASPWTPVTLNSNLTMSVGLSRGANLAASGTPAGSCWGGSGGWGTTDAASVYFIFTVNAGASVSLSSITGCLRRSNTGPASCQIEYSINGGAYSVAGSWATSVTSGTTGQANSTTLSGFAALQNLAAGTVVRIRITYPGSAGSGNWYVTNGVNSLRLNGTTALVPSYGVSIANSSSITCNGLSNGVLTASVSNGNAPYTYSWMPAGGTASVATGLAAGVYTCVVTDASLAVTSKTFNLSQPATLSISAVSFTNVTCFGAGNGIARTPVTGGTAAYSYSWMPAGGTASLATSLLPGTYTCSVNDANGCNTSATVSITQPASVTVLASASSTAICPGDSLLLSAGGANNYTWTGGATNGVAFSPTITATYTVTGSTAQGCLGTDSIKVIVNNSPSVTAIASSSAICMGGTVTLTGGGATTYSWSSNVTGTAAISPTVTDSYTVTGIDNNNCTARAIVTVTVNSNPTLTTSISPTIASVCFGGSVTLSATGASTYSWTGNAINNTAFTPSLSATYTVTGTDSLGCSSTATVPVTVYSLPQLTIAATPSTAAVCNGGSLTINASGASTFTWTGNLVNGATFTPTASTAYTVSGTDTLGCRNTLTLQVTVNANPTITISSSKGTICRNENAVITVNTTSNSAATYSWSNNGATTTSISVSPTITTIYTVTAYSQAGCSARATLIQTVNACAGIETYAEQQNNLVLYPNPNNGNFILKATSAVKLVVINELGQPVRHVELNETNNFESSVSDLNNGVYFVTGANAGVVTRFKVIVSK